MTAATATPRQLEACLSQVMAWAPSPTRAAVLEVLVAHVDQALAQAPTITLVDPMEFIMGIKREAFRRPAMPVVITDAVEDAPLN